MTLVEALQDRERMRQIVRDGAVIIDEEVAAKRGLTGKALRVGYRTIKKLKPGMIESSLAMLLPEFAPVIDPFYARAKDAGDVRGFFRDHRFEVAEALLSVTDARADVARNRVMIKVYRSLRSRARDHTAESVPRIPELIQKYDT